MSANVLLGNSSQESADVALGYSAKNASNFASNMGTLAEYSFPEPKTGIIAKVFPSESTWHNLYDHNYAEITQQLISADKAGLSNAKKRIGEVVTESYYVTAMGNLYKFLVAIAVISIIILLSGGSLLNWPKFYIISAIIAASLYGYAEIFAKGRGEAYWQEYQADVQSKAAVGMMPAQMLEVYRQDANKEKDRAALTASASRSSGLSTGLFAAAGSFFGTKV